MSARYACNSSAVFALKVHVVWCPKYRRAVLTGDVATRLHELLVEKSTEIGVKMTAHEIMSDHVHLFLEFPPTMGVAEIVNRLKGYTSRVLRQEFSTLRSRLPTLWSRSYFAGTTGAVSEVAVRRYIAGQKGK